MPPFRALVKHSIDKGLDLFIFSRSVSIGIKQLSPMVENLLIAYAWNREHCMAR
jgi:hypothetical protein